MVKHLIGLTQRITYCVCGSSVLEEDDERGVAHIIEHLAFSATNRYTNHDIVKFLESIGAEFGACQNAVTSADQTLYELFVPVDKPELLSQAISILAEFSSEVPTKLGNLIVVGSLDVSALIIVDFRFGSQQMIWKKNEELS